MSDPHTKSKENNQERQDEPYVLSASPVPPKEPQETGAILLVNDPLEVTGHALNAYDSSPPGNNEEDYINQPTPLRCTPSNPKASHIGLTIEGMPWKSSNLEPALADLSDQDRILSDFFATPLPLPATSSEASERTTNLSRSLAAPPVRQTVRVSDMTPTILARRSVVTVLVRAPFDTWYDQWMLQSDDAANLVGVDYFDDAVRMLEPAALGMAAVALRAHLDAHQAVYADAGVTLLVEPLVAQAEQIVHLLGVFETMHEDGAGGREDGELSFVETVAHNALSVPAYRAANSPFPAAIFAPDDQFFSAVDGSALLSDATLAEVKAHPEQYALVGVQVTALYAHLALLSQEADEPGASDLALTA